VSRLRRDRFLHGRGITRCRCGSIGAFAEPDFPPPTISVYESRRHPWLAITAEMEHLD
jgi:hypothetical protein